MADGTVPIRISNDLLKRIRHAAKIMDRSQQEIMRLAMEVGLEDLRLCNYDIAAAIVAKAKSDAKPSGP